MSISVGSVAVDVVPDTRGFATDLKAKLKDITADIKINAELAEFRAQIDEATRPRTATVNVNADTAVADARIDEVARDRRANVSVGGLGAASAGISGLGLAIAGLGPALVPVVAAIGGLGAALVAPIALAGGGLTIGALIAGAAVADTKKQQKALEELQKKVQSAKTAVETASTPAGKKSAMAREAEAVKAYQLALSQLSPQQKKFIEAQDKLKTSFQGLLTTAGPAIFGPMIQGLDLLSGVLPKLKPLLQGVADGIGTLLGDLSKAASGPGFRDFIKSFGSSAQGAIVAFGRIFENVSKGLFEFFKAFAPLSKAFVSALGGATRGFADWSRSLGSSKSFQSFLAYVKDVGPKVGDALGHIFEALGNIAVTVAPMGGLVVGLADGLAQLITNAKPAQLAAIATAIGAVGVAVLFATGGLSGLVPAIAGLGIGLSYAYTHSGKFRDIMGAIGRVFTDHLLPALKSAWQTVLPGLQSAFDSVKQSVHDNQGLFRVLGDIFKGIGTIIVKVVIPALAQFYRVELPLIGKAIGLVITGVRLLADGWLLMARAGLEGFKLLVSAALSSFGAILTAADAALGWIPKFGPKIDQAKHAFGNFKDGSVAALDAAIAKVKDLQTELDTVKPKTVKIHFQVDKPPALMVGGLPIFKPEGAGARGAIINRPTVALLGENGRERLTPLDQTPGNAPLPGGRGAPQFEFSGPIYAQDVNDFLRQVQTRARLSSLSGGRP